MKDSNSIHSVFKSMWDECFSFSMEKKLNGVNQWKKANYDLIPTVLFLFALIFFKDPQQYNDLPLYVGYMASV